MRKKVTGIIGLIGFFIAAGAGGGIEQDTMAWGPGLAWMALGLAVMLGSVICGRRSAR